MGEMNFLESARERYSCRKLTGTPVAAEKLEHILETACTAPTAHNEQSFCIFLLESPETVKKIREIIPYIFRAGYFLVVTAVPGEVWVRELDQASFAAVDASIVATHIIFAVEAEGLDMTWVGCFGAPRAKKPFPVMASYELITLFPIGEKTVEAYPAHLYKKGESIVDPTECF